MNGIFVLVTYFLCFIRGCELDPDLHYFWKLDSDPHESHYSGDLEAQNGAMKGRGRSQWRRWGSKWSPGGSETRCLRFASLWWGAASGSEAALKWCGSATLAYLFSSPSHVQINEIFIILPSQAWKSAARRKKRRFSTRIGKMAAYRTVPVQYSVHISYKR